MTSPGYRYGHWGGGPDPLAPPYDVGAALDALGDDVLEGASPREALDRLMRRGMDGRRGLDDLMRQVRRRRKEARERGRLDGTLERVKQLLEQALAAERGALATSPDDAARLAEAELDSLPGDPARAVRALAEHDWRSPEAAAAYAEIRDLLRREVLDSRFRGMKQALQGASPDEMARVRDMLADLNAMLEADERGEDTDEAFEQFMSRYGDLFPEQPESLDELVDSLARRAAAAERMMRSLTPAQREELANLMATAMEDLGLAAEMSRLSGALQSRRPDLDWTGRERVRGNQPLGVGDATSVLEELADLDEVEAALGQDYPGASLEDVDPEAVERGLGRRAVDDVAALRRLERELEEQGLLTRSEGRLELTPRAVRRIGATALRRVFADLTTMGRGGHDVADAGAAGELTGAARGWEFGDSQPLDVVRTVRNAVLRTGPVQTRRPGARVRLEVADFEVVETERRTRAAVCLLVDLSFSMAQRGAWGTAKSTALALHSLVTTRFPQDAVQVIGFSRYARSLRPTELAGLSWDMTQGTNLQHALIMAGRHLDRHSDAEPVVLLVTDGEPTAHLRPDGRAVFDWPPTSQTLALTLAEVERMTRRGATINVFLLDDDPRLVDFVGTLARRNGGRVLSPSPDRLGGYVVADYLQRRRGRSRRSG